MNEEEEVDGGREARKGEGENIEDRGRTNYIGIILMVILIMVIMKIVMISK